MRRSVAIGAIIVLLGALASCGGEGGGGAVNTDDAKMALIIGVTSIMTASFAMAFGQEVEGVSVDEETDTLVFDKFNLAEFFGDSDAAAEIPYTAVSGSVVNDNGEMAAKLELEGGPVKTIEFSLGEQELQSDTGFVTTVKVNGKQLELEITSEDLGG